MFARFDPADQLTTEAGGVGGRQCERDVWRHDQRDIVEVASRHEVPYEPHHSGPADADVKAWPVQSTHAHRLAQPLAGKNAVHAVVSDELAAAEPVDGQARLLEAVAHPEVA